MAKRTLIHESTMSIEMQSIMQKFYTQQTDKQNKAKDKLAFLIDIFKANGFDSIRIEYWGSGDEGEITDVSYYKNDGSMTEVMTANEFTQLKISNDEFRKANDQLDEVAYNLLTYDWYNNEGGRGYIDINLKTRKVKIDAYYHVQEERIADDQEKEMTIGKVELPKHS